MDKNYYLTSLYPLQDRVLQVINQAKTGFYLTGGTALSRAYLAHRFSDDLDLFTNMDHRLCYFCSSLPIYVAATASPIMSQ